MRAKIVWELPWDTTINLHIDLHVIRCSVHYDCYSIVKSFTTAARLIIITYLRMHHK